MVLPAHTGLRSGVEIEFVDLRLCDIASPRNLNEKMLSTCSRSWSHVGRTGRMESRAERITGVGYRREQDSPLQWQS